LDGQQIVLGAMLVNSLTFLVGAVLGQMWLWVRLGNLRSKRVLGVILFTLFASVIGAFAAVAAGWLIPDSLPVPVGAWAKLIVQSVVGITVTIGVLAVLRVDELATITKRLSTLRRKLLK